MRLKRLQIQGFKTFASKTVFEFATSGQGSHGVTGVIGPNGSGKSNAADAIRWVMGEQSLKLLRGRKSEDVIFSGTPNRPRSGFAEVTMVLENEDHVEIPYTEIEVTRRLYRDGESEYALNRQKTRLSEIQLLLAQCGVSQRSYSVIGQGLVDAVLLATPLERRSFFDEAAGVKPYQLKRDASVSKLEAARDHIAQAELVRHELEPRLNSLERQVKKLNERERVEAELRQLERWYYGALWQDHGRALMRGRERLGQLEARWAEKDAEVKAMESRFAEQEQHFQPISSSAVSEARRMIDAIKEERAKLRERQVRLEVRKESAQEIRAQKPWSPLPLSRILEELERLQEMYDHFLQLIENEAVSRAELQRAAIELRKSHDALLGRLQQPAPEPTTVPHADPELDRELQEVAQALVLVQTRCLDAESVLRKAQEAEDASRAGIFEVQRALGNLRGERHQFERQVSEARIEMARLEEREQALRHEVTQLAPHLASELETLVPPPVESDFRPAEAPVRLQRLRSQLEWIGGIDPETIQEYEATKTRVEELRAQMEDLQQAIASLEQIIRDLDETIATISEEAFKKLNKEFGHFFQKLFLGGEAKLVKVEREETGETTAEPETTGDRADVGTGIASNGEERDARRESGREEEREGIEILVTPPGKRLKAISLLSGGERSLTAIALICAIIAVNPSPFVVMDEVDAALDEANAQRFSEIIAELSDRTQFIVVTHNRHTMHRADALYGVTLSDDGTSQVLSVKLEDER